MIVTKYTQRFSWYKFRNMSVSTMANETFGKKISDNSYRKRFRRKIILSMSNVDIRLSKYVYKTTPYSMYHIIKGNEFRINHD